VQKKGAKFAHFREPLLSVEKLMHVGTFKNLQHITNIPIHLAYMRITESETITERT
jgi:hypothetical protein